MICKFHCRSQRKHLYISLDSSCLSVLYADDYQFTDDYKIILKTIPFEPSANALSQMQNPINESIEAEDNEWIDMTQKSTQFKRLNHQIVRTSYPLHTQQLIFYCLSPSVAFAKDLKLARTYVSSGIVLVDPIDLLTLD